MAASESGNPTTKLIVWDFDWSMINENCDVWVLKHLDASGNQTRKASAAEAAQETAHGKVGNKQENETIASTELHALQSNWMKVARNGGDAISLRGGRSAPTTWTTAMHELFQEAAHRGHTIQEIEHAMQDIPVFEQVPAAIRHAYDCGVAQIVLSDANTFLIDMWLRAVGLRDCISHIMSNTGTVGPLHYTGGTGEAQALAVAPLQPPTTPHGCKNPCPPNLCKGGTLLAYIQAQYGPDQAHWPELAYVGDGRGDLCALLQLPSGSSALVRGGYPLEKYTDATLPSSADPPAEQQHSVEVPAQGCADATADSPLVLLQVRSGTLKAERQLWFNGEDLCLHLKSFVAKA